MHKNIAFFEVEAWEKEWLVKNLGGFDVKFYSTTLDGSHLPPERHFHAVSVGSRSSVSADVLEVFPNLEMLAVRGRECAHIDLAACRGKKVMVARVPSYAVHAVAEFTFALMLAMSRKSCEVISRAKERGATLDRLQGFDLYGKTLGVLGTGNIGTAVIRIAKGFGMKVLAWNPRQNLQLATELDFPYMPLPSVLAHADILTVHVPYVQGEKNRTHCLLGRESLGQLKRGAFIVNTAHPDIVDADALAWAMEEGIVAGAAIDGEARMLPERLLKNDRLLLTPRAAFNTRETLEYLLRVTAENIRAYFGSFPQNIIGEKIP